MQLANKLRNPQDGVNKYKAGIIEVSDWSLHFKVNWSIMESPDTINIYVDSINYHLQNNYI
jgi:hypothetical protein